MMTINKLHIGTILCVLAIVFFFMPTDAHAADLQLSPSSSSFYVGSTFDVSLALDTEGESVNAVDIEILFPSNKVQLVDTQTNFSVISLWVRQPTFDNQQGIIRLQGGIPGGVTSENARIATFTFRATSVGSTVIQFGDQSKVLLNDGTGLNVLEQTTNGVFDLLLSPPNGPIISSTTHPQEDVWYRQNDVRFNWEIPEGADGYSYVLNQNPNDVPDDIVDGEQANVGYADIASGTHFFHIKALRNGVWGGVSHFAVNIDDTPPAQFPIKILPSAQTASPNPIISFQSSDSHSGLSHYTIAVIPLSKNAAVQNEDQYFFIETSSPYIVNDLSDGTYDVIVRAHDHAGNIREVSEKLEIVPTIISLSARRGIIIENTGIISWWIVWPVIIFIIGLLLFFGFQVRRRHRAIAQRQNSDSLPPHLKEELNELHAYRSKYGKLQMIALLVTALFLFGAPHAFAQSEEIVSLEPPAVEIMADAISNTEIFYAGGITRNPFTDVVLYLQNQSTQETWSFITQSDDDGNWFYRHETFLPAGTYDFWLQAKADNQYSPPSPKESFIVQKAALQFGISRISATLLFRGLLILSLVCIVLLITYILYHRRQADRKEQLLEKEIHEAEKSIHRGFASLRRDITEDLKKLRTDDVPDEEQAVLLDREEQLLKDLRDIEGKIGKEIDDISSQMR